MDVLPAHLNRDSFRDSLKGLVVLEIIIDLPFGFPINNIISLCLELHNNRVLDDLAHRHLSHNREGFVQEHKKCYSVRVEKGSFCNKQAEFTGKGAQKTSREQGQCLACNLWAECGRGIDPIEKAFPRFKIC